MHSRAISVLFVLIASTGWAQVDTGAISGFVRDASGAYIAGSDVVIRAERTNIESKLTTNASGFFSAPSLRPGTYTISVNHTAFTAQQKQGVELRVQERLEISFELQVHSTSTEVTVQAEAPLLESDSSSRGNVVQGKTIQDLPLNGRNFSQLAILGAGTLPSKRSAERDAFVANGARPVQNSYLLDGIDNRNRIVGFDSSSAQSIQPVLDGIQEFKVQTNNYSAEFGQSAGGVVNVTMKSGTNDIHGSLFEFHRNSAVSATPYFQVIKGVKPQFLQNQFGATLGGPLIKNRTFYFASWQSSRELSTAPQIGSVPLPAQQQGNFAGRLIYDPATVRTNPNGSGYVRDAFPGSIIPRNRWDSVAANLAPLYPAPNLPGAARNLQNNPKQSVFGDQGNIRVDHQLSSRDSIFGRFSIFDSRNALPPVLPDPANNRMVASPTSQSAAASYTRTIAPTVINEFRFGFMRTRLQQQALVDRLFEQYGINGVYQDDDLKGLPTFGITGLSTLGTTGPGTLNIAATGSGNLPIDKSGKVYQFIDNLTWITGRHSIRFGGDITQSTLHAYVTLQARPAINFGGVYTQDPQSRSTTGSAYADFLLGLANNVTVSNRPLNDSRQRIYQGYVQDDWKVNNRLALNLGLRYELAKPFVEVNGRQANYVLDAGPYYGKLVNQEDAGQLGLGPALVRTDYNNFAPRVGLAYKATQHTVVRSAFGVFFGRDENLGISNRITNNPPFFVRSNLVSDQINPNFILSVGFPPGILDPAKVVNPEVNSYPFDFALPYTMQWNVNIQQELPGRFVLETGYTGSGSRKLYYSNNVNQAYPGAGNVDSRRPMGGVSNVYLYGPLMKASYHALLLQLEKRYSSGLSLLAGYTYGHIVDDGPAASDTDQKAQYARDLRANRGSAAYDIRQRLVTSGSYELPFGRGKRFGADNKVASALAGGWQFNGIATFQTGLPFTPTLNFDPSNAGATARPNRITDGNLPEDQRTPTRWFDLSAFSAPPSYLFGNSGRNFLEGPGQMNFDIGISRAFTITERIGLQFRAEAFNLLNTPQFAVPAATIGNANAGAIESVVTPERQLQFALRLTF